MRIIINLQAVIDSWDYRFAASLKVCSQEWILTAKLNTNLQRAIITRAWLGLMKRKYESENERITLNKRRRFLVRIYY